MPIMAQVAWDNLKELTECKTALKKLESMHKHHWSITLKCEISHPILGDTWTCGIRGGLGHQNFFGCKLWGKNRVQKMSCLIPYIKPILYTYFQSVSLAFCPIPEIAKATGMVPSCCQLRSHFENDAPANVHVSYAYTVYSYMVHSP